MNTLRPLTDYIDELDNKRISYGDFYHSLIGRAQFGKRPLSLDQFIPCKDGKPLEKPNVKNYEGKDVRNIDYDQDCLRYETALSKVLFKGWGKLCTQYNQTVIVIGGEGLSLHYNIEDKIFYAEVGGMPEYKYFTTIESIAHLNLELTETGKEQML